MARPTKPRHKPTPTAWPETDDLLYPQHGHDADDPPHPHGKRRDPHIVEKKLRRKREILRRKKKEFELKIWEEREKVLRKEKESRKNERRMNREKRKKREKKKRKEKKSIK